MQRFHQIVLAVSVLLLSWLWMQGVHELGHIAAAWLTGGAVVKVVLHPLAISRTDYASNPHPLLVAWAGPAFGGLAPLAVWGAAHVLRLPLTFLLRFFAGFCLLANGLYIGLGSFQGVGDCGDLLRHGASHWQLWLFGIAAAPPGLLLWSGLGPDFGIGKQAKKVPPALAYTIFGLLVVTLVVEFCFGGESLRSQL